MKTECSNAHNYEAFSAAIKTTKFVTRRRNRVNGRIVQTDEGRITFKVDQSFGNCPQYIKPRTWRHQPQRRTASNIDSKQSNKPTSTISTLLSAEQIDHIEKAETVFFASGYRSEGEDPRFGNDASHRGGPSGFIKVDAASNTLILPDYPGNDMFNIIGNLVMDGRMGITIPLYETGGMIQLTGRPTIEWDEDVSAQKYATAKRIIEFHVDAIVELPAGSLPIRWASNDVDLQLKIAEKHKESDDVTSFYLVSVDGESPILPSFQPGQYLPIILDMGEKGRHSRTYSLSGSSSKRDMYRISVKREAFSLVSQYLHDDVEEGDVLMAQKPAGQFILNDGNDDGSSNDSGSDKALVLLSAGIGVTPVLSMLHKFVESSQSSTRMAYWIHGASNGRLHPFQGEIAGLQKLVGDSSRLGVFTLYSKPNQDDLIHDETGRITIEFLHRTVHDLVDADVFMCGPASFLAGMQSKLE